MEMKEFLPPWLGWRRKQEREGLLVCLGRDRRGGRALGECWGSEINFSNKLFIFFGIDFVRRLQDQSVSSKFGFANIFPKILYASSRSKELAPAISH
jgi:hypothetical protein